jgi:predicted amidohydrolase
MTFWGGNRVVNARGKELVKGKYFEEDTPTTDIDPSELEFIRANRPTIRDSRVELFQSLIPLLEPKFNKNKSK